jgi:hypothetical protein
MTVSSTTSSPYPTPLEIPSATKSRKRGSNPSRTRKPRPQDVHAPDALPPAVTALLAITDIPMRRRSQSSTPSSRSSSTAAAATTHRRRRRNSSSVGSKLVRIVPTSPPSEVAIFSEIENEKELPVLSPLEFLLSPPGTDDDEEEDGATSVCETTSVAGSWTGTGLTPSLSTDSMSSLCSLSLSVDAVSIASSGPRSRRLRPVRQELEPVAPSVDDDDHLEHPLAGAGADDFETIDADTPEDDAEVKHLVDNYFGRTIRPFKSAIKSNLTASLRAIRSAARSISALTIPPDDLITRSILTMDPKVPYTDERRPPVLADTPSPALRRYLNPTSSARIAEPRARGNSNSRAVPMQTYKIERSRSITMSAPPPSIRMRSHHTPPPSPEPVAAQTAPPLPLPPAMRPREMRENPDFIRIAVMEMAMRRSGKLDDNKPGRARWALPPRKCSNNTNTTPKPYAVRADGVPERWVPITIEY